MIGSDVISRREKSKFIRIIAAAVLTAAAVFIPSNSVLKVLLYVLPYIVIGYDVVWSAIRNILHGQMLDEQFLMFIATVGAFGLGEYLEAVAVMLFYQVGELFQDIAVGKSRKNIASLMNIRPDTATVLRNGSETVVSPDEVAVGETIVVKPGEKIPLDGIVTDGTTTLNTAALTGESLPRKAEMGDKVVSGSINLTGVIRVRTESIFAESTVSKILELVENASSKKAKVENFITRFARIYTPCVVGSALLLALIPPIFNGEWGEWISRALIFLVVSCPCALVISVPLSFFGGIGGASKKGILIKGAGYLEVLSKIETVVFDKTGTLTKGTFTVTDIHPECVTEAELLDIAAAAESYSHHPIAESIIAAHGGHLDEKRLGEVTEHPGYGIVAAIDGKNIYVGNGKLMNEVGANWHECELTGTIIHISEDSKYLGHIVVSDEIKPEAAEAIANLKKCGVKKTVMLTGDRREIGEDVAKKVGVDEALTELLPQGKVNALEEMITEKSSLAFVGDGINDAPVLTRADVGIAMGALGSDAAIEAADIVLMDDDLRKLPLAVRIARKTMFIAKENIAFALAVKLIILTLGALGYVNIWFAIFADVGVTVIAVLNAMRTMR